MASVASGQSPHQVYETLMGRDPNVPDNEEDWAYIDAPSSSNPGSIGFLPSPATGSMASWGVIGHQGVGRTPPPAPSPLNLNLDLDSAGLTSFPTEFSHDQVSSLNMNVTNADISQWMSSPGVQTPSDLGGQPMIDMGDFIQFQPQVDLTGLTPFSPTSFPTSDVSAASLQQFVDVSSIGQTTLDLSTLPLQSAPNSAPWNPAAVNTMKDNDPIFIMDGFHSSPSPVQTSASVSPLASSPHSPPFMRHDSSPSGSVPKSTPSPIRRVQGNRVGKRKQLSPDAPSAAATNIANQFVLMTPDTMANKPFECFEAMGRATQKGRKGPLANEIKENALQVRRTGACFCCHARKVKCDTNSTCKNCEKLMCQVPQVMCWRFGNFTVALFPLFFRRHLKKDEVSRFVTESADFIVNGAELPCVVQLSSGWRWKSALTVKAKFFTPISEEVKKHWHMSSNRDQISLEQKDSVHIGLDFDSGPQREELKKRIKEYLVLILQEPLLIEQLTETLQHTMLPFKILQIARRFAALSDSPMVKKALNIYALQYVMTRHLCLNDQTLKTLQQLGHASRDANFITPRLLNRQLKAIIDEMLIREMETLFHAFAKSLKPKSRKEWPDCTAAFLVLCLFMEAVETTADQFCVSARETVNAMANNGAQGQALRPVFNRQDAVKVNREIENMPFKQFAYQFHQIYQTHVRDAGTKAYNPLRDDSLLLTPGELDPAAVQLALDLRQLTDNRAAWDEMNLLAMDPILDNDNSDSSYPMDVAFNYTGRLTAKFLMSFYDEDRIFG